ncbi:MAG: putative peptidoglycan glycosyltransferase FtsW [Rhodothermales bacterium]
MGKSVTTSLTKKLGWDGPADRYVVWVVLFLAALGVVAVYSAISFLAATKSGGDTERFLLRHVARVGAALAVMLFFSGIDYRKLARFSQIALAATLGLLVVVQIVGVASGGATRWIRFGSVGFQPSDLARVALILYVGVLLAKKQDYIKSFSRAFIPVFVWILLACVLIGIEDLSTALMLLVATAVMCFVARVSVLHLGGLGAVASLLAILLLLGSPGRAARVESYLGMKLFPHTATEEVFNEQGEGYQAQQARIAFAMGGLTGVGPGKSVQRDFLPAPYNDFIFAIVAEEYGLLGALVLLGAFVALLFRGFLRIARHAPDPLGLFVGVGLTVSVVLYAFVHAGVACGLLPVTGLPLPFVSYGGTSMVATGMMLGILLNISRQCR